LLPFFGASRAREAMYGFVTAVRPHINRPLALLPSRRLCRRGKSRLDRPSLGGYLVLGALLPPNSPEMALPLVVAAQCMLIFLAGLAHGEPDSRVGLKRRGDSVY